MQETYTDTLSPHATHCASLKSTISDHEPSSMCMSEGSHYTTIGTFDGYIFTFSYPLIHLNCYTTNNRNKITQIFTSNFNTILIVQDNQLTYYQAHNTSQFINGLLVPQQLKIISQIQIPQSSLFRLTNLSYKSFSGIIYSPEEHWLQITQNNLQPLQILPPINKPPTDYLLSNNILILQYNNILFVYHKNQHSFIFQTVFDCKIRFDDRLIQPHFNSKEQLETHSSLYTRSSLRINEFDSFTSELVKKHTGNDVKEEDGMLLLVQFGKHDFCDILIQYANFDSFDEISSELQTYKKILVEFDFDFDFPLQKFFNYESQRLVLFKPPQQETSIKKSDFRTLALFRSDFSQTLGLVTEKAILNALIYDTNCYFELTNFNFGVICADIKPEKKLILGSGKANLIRNQAVLAVCVRNDDGPCVYRFQVIKWKEMEGTGIQEGKGEVVEREDEFDEVCGGGVVQDVICRINKQLGRLGDKEGQEYPGEVDEQKEDQIVLL